jgi:subtilisin family serine protease
MVSMLEGLTSAAQASYVTVAKSLGLETQQLWISNVILVKGLTSKTLAQLAATPGEFIIRPQNTASIQTEPDVDISANITQTNQWGVEKIRAPEAWAVSNGAGCVAGIIDTGVNIRHEALSAGFAGSWSDPYYNTAGPTDQHGHGSHCMGTILGRSNGVGVAPGATWVACRGLNHQGSGTEAALLSCGQFMLNSVPRPNVISHTWSGGSGDSMFDSTISAWVLAGIIPVFPVGEISHSVFNGLTRLITCLLKAIGVQDVKLWTLRETKIIS